MSARARLNAVWFGCALLFGALLGCAPRAEQGTVTVSFVGDILLDSAPGQNIARGQDPFAPTQALFRGVDLSIGNLECPVATGGAAVNKVYTFRAAPSTLPTLRQHFHAVSIANNHSGDYGPDAFRETLQQLQTTQIPYFGGGNDATAAHEPLLLSKRGLKIALLGYDDYHPRSFEASATQPGVAWAEPEQILLDIAAARRAGAHVILPFLHWGWENERAPSAHQRELARLLIDAGADAVIGSHPHVTQGAEMYHGKPILYSLGNFVFDLLDFPENHQGWVVRLELDRSGVVRFSTAAVLIDDQGTPAPDPSVETLCGQRGDAAPTPCAQRP